MKTKALIRLRGCAGWSMPLLFAYGISRFCGSYVNLTRPRLFDLAQFKYCSSFVSSPVTLSESLVQTMSNFRSLSIIIWTASSEFVSSSIPSWQTFTAHAQPFRGARDLAFCLKVPLDSLLVWASSGGSGETAQMRRLAWTFAAHIGDKYQICLTQPIYLIQQQSYNVTKFLHKHLLHMYLASIFHSKWQAVQTSTLYPPFFCGISTGVISSLSKPPSTAALLSL